MPSEAASDDTYYCDRNYRDCNVASIQSWVKPIKIYNSRSAIDNYDR
jgi:hypothetical protein